MTVVSSILTDAYRESNLVAVGKTETTDEQTEALARLNALLSSSLGNEAGDDRLVPVPLGDNNISTSAASYASIIESREWLPFNVRLMCNLTAAKTLKMHPFPQDGSRFAVIDLSANFSTYNLVLEGNGRLIEGATSVTLSVDSTSRSWIFREDTGSWQKITDVLTTDEMPYPEAFDDFFITKLAMRLNPRYGRSLSTETVAMLEETQERFQARYRQVINVPCEAAILKLSRQAYGKRPYTLYGPLSPVTAGDRGVTGWPGSWPFR